MRGTFPASIKLRNTLASAEIGSQFFFGLPEPCPQDSVCLAGRASRPQPLIFRSVPSSPGANPPGLDALALPLAFAISQRRHPAVGPSAPQSARLSDARVIRDLVRQPVLASADAPAHGPQRWATGAPIELSEACSSVGQLEARASEGLALAPLPKRCVVWTIGGYADDRFHARQSAPLGGRRKRGSRSRLLAAHAEGATRRYTHLQMLRGASSPFC